MSKLEVQSIQAREPFKTPNGQLYPFFLMGLLDGQLDSVSMNFKGPENAPKVGEILEITVEEGKYGKKAKKIQANSFTGAGGYQRSPEDQDRIMRQHAVMDSIAWLSVKAPTMKKEDLSVLKQDSVLLAAEVFLDYYKNGLKKAGSEVFAERHEPLPAEEAAEELEF